MNFLYRITVAFGIRTAFIGTTLFQVPVLCLILIHLSGYDLAAQAPTWEWANAFHTSNEEAVLDMVVDHFSGDLYIVGQWEADLSGFFPAGIHPGTDFSSTYGNKDGFVARFDSIGNLIWAFKLGGSDDDIVLSIDTDPMGNIYVTGSVGVGICYYSGTSPPSGPATLDNSDFRDFYLAKFNPDGEFQWVRRSLSNSTDVDGMEVTFTGSAIYCAGYYDGQSPDFGAVSAFNTSNQIDLFLIKYDLSGTEQWVAVLGSDGDDYPGGLSADDSSVFISGIFDGDTLFFRNSGGGIEASQPNVNNNRNEIFVSGYDQNGNYKWSQTISSTGDDEVHDMTADSEALYLTGVVDINTIFPGHENNPVNAAVNPSTFLSSHIKLNGNTRWVSTLPSNNNAGKAGKAIDVFGDFGICVSGEFKDELYPPEGPTLMSSGNTDIFIAAYTRSGGFRWAVQAGSTGAEEAHGLAIGARGEIYTGGIYADTLTLGSHDLPEDAKANAFVGMLSDSCIHAVGGSVAASTTEICVPGQSILTLSDYLGDIQWQKAFSGSDDWFDIIGESGDTLTVFPLADTRYRAYLTVEGCNPDSSNIIEISAFEIPVADPGPGGSTCGNTFGLQANLSVGTGQWTLISGPGTALFLPDAATPDADAIVSSYGTYLFKWEEINGPCTDDSIIEVTYTAPPASDAGPDDEVCIGEGSYTLSGTSSANGMVSWTSSGDGSFDNDSLDNPVYTFGTEKDSVILLKTVTSPGSCDNATDSMRLILLATPDAITLPGGITCSEQFQLHALHGSGTGTWSVSGPGTVIFDPSENDPDPVISVDTYGEYRCTWILSNGICQDSITVYISFLDGIEVHAGQGGTGCGLSFLLSAVKGQGNGTWSKTSGPGDVMFSPADTLHEVTAIVDHYGSYQFRWQVTSGDCSGSDSVLVNFVQQPEADAGSDQVLDYVFSAMLQANQPEHGIGKWEVVEGSGTLADANDPETEVNGLSVGENVLKWGITSEFCTYVEDMVTITVNDLFRPTVITPNSDGLNDFLVFPGIELQPGTRLIVFNRWGSQVYSNDNYQNQWDGKDHNGRDLESDTYYYILRLHDGKEITGFIAILR